MLIPICGPSSCGKTTLIQTLQEKNIPSVGIQFARTLLKRLNLRVEEIQTNLKVGYEFHEDLLTFKKNEELPFLELPTLFLTERSFLDIAVYFICYHYTPYIAKKIYLLKNHTVISRSIQLTNKFYKKIIYLEEIPNLEEDGTRIIDPEFINNQKQVFQWLFSFLTIPLIKIQEEDLNQRVNQIFPLLTTN